jgi:hypothetical protein
LSIQQRQLAKVTARLRLGKLCLFAVLVALVDTRRTLEQHIQRVRILALLDHRGVRRQRADVAALGQRDELVRGQTGE